MKRSKLIALTFAFLASLLLGACSMTSPTEKSAVSATSAASSQKTHKIGCTIQDLSNPIWAAKEKTLADLCKEKGWEFTSVDCSADSGKQISQIENFITSGCDVVIVQPADPNSLTSVSAEAHQKGIIMMADGVTFTGEDLAYINNNYYVGQMVGTSTGNWLNKTFGKNVKSEVAVLAWPSIKECIDRVNGMKAGLAAVAPNASIVATVSAANVTDGMSNAENILEAHPNVRAFMSFGDGGALGVAEVLESKKISGDKVGIFAIDGSDQGLAAIKKATNFKMSVSMGSSSGQAKQIFEALTEVYSGNYKKVYYTPNTAVTLDNVDKFMTSNASSK